MFEKFKGYHRERLAAQRAAKTDPEAMKKFRADVRARRDARRAEFRKAVEEAKKQNETIEKPEK